ncbi:hypothetical protein [Nostoc sp.]
MNRISTLSLKSLIPSDRTLYRWTQITIQKSSACFGSCNLEPQINAGGRS